MALHGKRFRADRHHGTAQAVGPDLDPLTVGASRIALGGALLVLVALAAAAIACAGCSQADAPWGKVA